MVNFKGAHFPPEIILMGIRWYVAYPLSYRHVEELLKERGIEVDHATLNRWVVKYSPELEKSFFSCKKTVGKSWRMDETYIRVKGKWVYLYRAVDKAGQTVDFYLSQTRDLPAAEAFFKKAIDSCGVPDKVNMDKSGANLAGLNAINDALPEEEKIEIRQVKYLNNLVEQDHRGVKRIVKPMLGFKSFSSAAATLAGIELHHMLKKGQMITANQTLPVWQQFYALAA